MSRLALAAFGIGVSVLGAGLLLVVLGAYYDAPDVPDAEVVWSASVGTGRAAATRAGPTGDAWHPAASDEVVLLGGPGGVSAHDPADGRTLWRAEVSAIHAGWIAGQDAIYIGENLAYVATINGVVALDLESGEEAWRHPLPREGLVSAQSAAGLLVVNVQNTEQADGGPPGWVAVIGADGAEAWRTELLVGGYGMVATDGERVFVQESRRVSDGDEERTESDLVAYDLASGTEFWRLESDSAGSPFVTGEHLAVVTAGAVVGVDPLSGAEIWRYVPDDDTPMGLLHRGGPDLFAAIIYVVERDDVGHQPVVVALDAATGEESWTSTGTASTGGIVAEQGVLALSIWDPGRNEVVGLDTATGEQSWYVTVGEPDARGGGQIRLAAAGGTIYFVDPSGRFRAVDASDGTERWTVHPASPVAADDAPVVHDSVLYLTGRDGLVRAFEAAGGERIWEQRLGTLGYSQPAVRDGRVFAVAGLGSVRAYDSGSGEEVWRSENRLDSVGQAVRPVVAAGAVVAGADDIVWAHDPATGVELWETRVDGEIAGLASPAPDAVVAADTSGAVRLLTATTGAEVWAVRPAGDDPIASRPVVADGVVLVATDTGRVLALDPRDGSTVWTHDLEVAAPGMPAAADGSVYLADGTVLLALDAATGEVAWTHESDVPLAGPPSVVDGSVHITSGDRDILVLDATDGSEIDVIEMNEDLVPAPTAADGLVFVVGRDSHRLFALR